MRVRVKGYLTFRDLIHEMLIELPDESASTMIDLLQAASDQLGTPFTQQVFDPCANKLHPHVALLINGVHHGHLPNRLETLLADGDEIAIFPPIAGGGSPV